MRAHVVRAAGRLSVTEPRAVASGIKTQAQKLIILRALRASLLLIPLATARGSVQILDRPFTDIDQSRVKSEAILKSFARRKDRLRSRARRIFAHGGRTVSALSPSSFRLHVGFLRLL